MSCQELSYGVVEVSFAHEVVLVKLCLCDKSSVRDDVARSGEAQGYHYVASK